MPTIGGILDNFASEIVCKTAIDFATIHAEHLSKFDSFLVGPFPKGLQNLFGQRLWHGV
jgi:hypothetical protein